MERQSCEEKLGKMDLFPLKKSQGRHHSISVFEAWLQKVNTEAFQEQQVQAALPECFTVRTIIHLNNFPREMKEFPSLEILKMGLDRVLNNLI